MRARRTSCGRRSPQPAPCRSQPPTPRRPQACPRARGSSRRARRHGTGRADAREAPEYASASMRVFVIGAGQVGFAIVDALHADHDLTVLDTEASRLAAFAERYDVATFEGDGTSRQDLVNAGVTTADLVIACTS